MNSHWCGVRICWNNVDNDFAVFTWHEASDIFSNWYEKNKSYLPALTDASCHSSLCNATSAKAPLHHVLFRGHKCPRFHRAAEANSPETQKPPLQAAVWGMGKIKNKLSAVGSQLSGKTADSQPRFLIKSVSYQEPGDLS